jgi:Ca-activated chloride channel family protein
MIWKHLPLVFAAATAAAVLPAQQPPATTPGPQKQAPAAQKPDPAPNTQAPNPGQVQSDVNTPTLNLGVNEVDLIFTVTDRKGHYIPNLKQSDFALLDNQRAPAKIDSFHQQINLPMRVGFLIDTSTSIRSRFQFEQQAAINFLLDIVKPRSDRAFVMGFDVTPNVTANWTNDVDSLEQGINNLSPGGGTALYDALYTACRYKMMDISRGQEPVRKAIILISDGDDDQSRVYEDEAIKECQRAETIVYSVSTNWTPSRGPGDKVMSALAEQTGGRPFFPASVQDISTSFKQIEEELRSQYALTYTPADFKYDGSFHSIYLYCTDRRYVARTKAGYFAPRQVGEKETVRIGP